MLSDDWEYLQWALNNINTGLWHEPDVVAFEYSGIGKGFFEATTDSNVLLEQIPRMYEMVHQI
jgi:hypothetical protein